MALNRKPTRIYGRRYGAYRAFLTAVDGHYDATSKVLAVVNDASQRVPYYRRHLEGGPVGSLREFEERVGFLDRGIVEENSSEFISEEIDLSSYDRITTGGTSGKPLQLIAPHDRHIVEMATMHSLWARAGYAFDVRAVIRNHRLAQERPYVVNPITREVIFDGFRLDHEYFAGIYDMISKCGIRFIHCYPSTAYEFATFLAESGRDASSITAFLSGSENVFEYQRNLIEGKLGIRFYNWYGHTEKLVLAGHCRNSRNYHVEPTYGYFELVDEEGGVVREPGGLGEIVGTSLHNPAMPLIRYRTGDFAEYVGDYCPECNRHLPLIRNIRGRWAGDRIYNVDGSFVTTTALNLHNELYQVINGMQYLQEKKGELTILIVKSPVYNESHERALIEHFRGRLAMDTRVEIRYVDRLMRKENGKFVHIISTVAGADVLRQGQSSSGSRAG
jgi:phenylacetate-CoA ligase